MSRMQQSLIALFCLVCFAAAAVAQPDLSKVPEACLNTGTELQTDCQPEFDAANTFFSSRGVNVTSAAAAAAGGAPAAPVNLTLSEINAYIAQAPTPSPRCCKTAQAFNDAGCSCNDDVLQLAVQFTGNNLGMYNSIAKGFATACGFPVFVNSTCPAAGNVTAGLNATNMTAGLNVTGGMYPNISLEALPAKPELAP